MCTFALICGMLIEDSTVYMFKRNENEPTKKTVALYERNEIECAGYINCVSRYGEISLVVVSLTKRNKWIAFYDESERPFQLRSLLSAL